MKTTGIHFISRAVLILLAFSCMSAWAAERAKTYHEALEKAGDEGVLIYLYGPDWNRRSVKMLESFWQKNELERAAGNSVLVALPIYQRPTAEQKAEQEEIQSGFPLPPPHRYRSNPTVVMLDKTGRTYAILSGNDDLGDGLSGSKACQLIQKNKALLAQQLELMNKAEQASGLEKAKLIGQASTLGIDPPHNAAEQIRTLDPKDESGYVRRLNYDPRKFQEEHKDAKSTELESPVLKIVNDTAYSPLQRQETYCILIGQLRRDGAAKNVLRKHLLAMQQIDPNSMYGKITPSLLTQWCGDPAPKTTDKDSVSKKKHRKRDK